MSIVCFLVFLAYEFSVGIYYPAVGYLRSRIMPEEFRATLSNWFRVPMNLVTCISLTLNYGSDSKDVSGLKKFQFVFTLCSILMIGSMVSATIFSKKYSKKVVHDEVQESRSGKTQNTETV
uniref:Molybdate-anion transporter n=2 Tax=Rhodnius prolixus TaxID=13249 RepID=T1I343_RHOPR